ncbi:mediator of RNA polymerase II transcription subunit 18-like [Lolium rigidum]|uniref:mediator of RNA polymerase II transcription subunit 18-like n=1 Tax=Lolium rigidum TaxID=89674 RepID=UPI001F5D9819|nr:mediator of RNA polymerase II transcription subunit 18-like [Lolium rigidum]
MQHVEAPEVLLRGLSGVQEECVRVHELCLESRPNLGVLPSEVCVLCDLAQPTPYWTIRHVGGSMIGAAAEQISIVVRTVVESKASSNVLRYIYTTG